MTDNKAFMMRGLEDQPRYQWPAWELVRYEERKAPRDWPARWVAAGGEMFDGRMIAAKDSPVWQALGDGAGGYDDALGNWYPPFASGSGMGVCGVRREEALDLGVISKDDAIAKMPPKLAEALRRDAEDLGPELLAELAELVRDWDKGEPSYVRMRRILDEEVAAAEAAYRSNE